MAEDTAGYAPIGGYALIGNARTAALVSRAGSVDWMCLPRFDGDPIFGALLDAAVGGRFSIQPPRPFETERRYLPDTNILETTFRTPTGACVLRDLFTISDEAGGTLTPDHELLREAEGLEGSVEFVMRYEPRRDYGRATARIEERGALGMVCEVDTGAMTLLSDAPMQLEAGSAVVTGRLRVAAGERHYWSATYSAEAPAVILPLGDAARTRIEATADWWRGWASRCTYHGPYRDQVVRSALALKLLTYAPSGAIVAAPTTSLPEHVGGDRNWDYRYCWLRDAAFTVRALLRLGYQEEALAFAQWMLHATRLTHPRLQVVYDVFGEAHLPERTLDHLEGYRGSRPVRLGNGAHDQVQIDVYGEVVRSFAHCVDAEIPAASGAEHFLRGLGDTVCASWDEPDHGIWESRGPRARHTLSMALCAVALEDLLGMHDQGVIRVPVERYREVSQRIRREIETNGYNSDIGSYTATPDGDQVDASLLTLPLYDYIDAADPRMQSTLRRIREQLARGNLYYRSEVASDGSQEEGTFAVCAFWAIELMALAGEVDHARKAFEDVLSYANDVGLFAEEIDPDSGEALGNMPQAFTHIGVINAAVALVGRISE